MDSQDVELVRGFSAMGSLAYGLSLLAFLFFLVLSGGVWGQDLPIPQPEDHRQTQADVPPGFPYNVGMMAAGTAAGSTVPLRDYMSSRLDGLRVEILNLMNVLIEQLRQIIDERDQQYKQRFEAQEKAVTAALAAADRAVTKSEAVANERFDKSNEFRLQLDDQAKTFVTKDTFAQAVKSIDDKLVTIIADTNRNTNRLDAIAAVREESKDNTGYWFALGGVFIGAAGLIMAFRRQQTVNTARI